VAQAATASTWGEPSRANHHQSTRGAPSACARADPREPCPRNGVQPFPTTFDEGHDAAGEGPLGVGGLRGVSSSAGIMWRPTAVPGRAKVPPSRLCAGRCTFEHRTARTSPIRPIANAW